MSGKLFKLKQKLSISPKLTEVKKHVSEVTDPEIPVLTIADLGILRAVEELVKDGKPFFRITITPTYSGCPANDVIATSVRLALIQNGISNFEIRTQLSPAWSTDWITDEAHDKLRAYGIAPPSNAGVYQCPVCNSEWIELISDFGSTACKALYKCNSCSEPFEVFKCH